MDVIFRKKGSAVEHGVYADSVRIWNGPNLPAKKLPGSVSLEHMPVVFMSGKKWGPLKGKIQTFLQQNPNFSGAIVYSYSWANGWGDGLIFTSFDAAKHSKILSAERIDEVRAQFEEEVKIEDEEKRLEKEKAERFKHACKVFQGHWLSNLVRDEQLPQKDFLDQIMAASAYCRENKEFFDKMTPGEVILFEKLAQLNELLGEKYMQLDDRGDGYDLRLEAYHLCVAETIEELKKL